MCYFYQTKWACGYWRWGQFKQQCNKEYRTGETCGLKLVFETIADPDRCKLCYDMDKKRRRLDKMQRDMNRWHREGNRKATIERTHLEMQDVGRQLQEMEMTHYTRQNTIT
ncbi:hypothetical protein C8034_v008408 [Colletotrichum sidae]|uniref:Uncharacterized protein n=2 Tax=Colletotrichum orbiculare species complex TaxID=2707354 RepID=A0A4R8QRF4_COLTR|nr:hypothetical protein CTRI78_v009156 [Colletotrichum trifolii]TEA19536.1 hypothetical protein C8034_v008408 [Colletotrichum sidae]